MKTKDLRQAISILKASACQRVTQPILANVALNGRMVATNLDCWAIVDMPTGVNTTASLAQLDKLLRNVKTEDVSFSQEGHHLKVLAGSLKTTLNGLPADEYPDIPSLDVKHALTLDGRRFLSAIKKLAYSVGDESQYILGGICLKVSQSGLEMASTDGSRLGKYADPSVTSAAPFEAVIPGQYLAAFHKSMQSCKEDAIRLEIAPDMASLRMGKVHFIVRTLDGFYPVYNQLIPNAADARHRFTLEKADLEKAIRQIRPFANPRTNVIRFAFSQGVLTLKTNMPDIGESEIALSYRPVCAENGELVTAFNYAYLMDALQVIESETVQLSMNGPLHPATLIGQDDPHYLALVMPVKVK